MPNVRIYIESSLTHERQTAISDVAETIRQQFSRAMHGLPENCHVMFTPALGCYNQAPCYVDLDYRPTPERTEKIVRAACVELKLLLESKLGVQARIRANAQDVSRVTAID
jgi:hypothetical protein